MERDWAEDGCKQKGVAAAFLADDFQGTGPGGERYDKAEALKFGASVKEHECRLDDAKVRFFGDNVAVIYGSERAVSTEKGKEVHALSGVDRHLAQPWWKMGNCRRAGYSGAVQIECSFPANRNVGPSISHSRRRMALFVFPTMKHQTLLCWSKLS